MAKLSIRLKDEFEKARLEVLAGDDTVTDFILGLAFHVRRTRGLTEKFPGWEVVERNRRDGGIKIDHPKHEQSVVLYPEDDEYSRFFKL